MYIYLFVSRKTYIFANEENRINRYNREFNLNTKTQCFSPFLFLAEKKITSLREQKMTYICGCEGKKM